MGGKQFAPIASAVLTLMGNTIVDERAAFGKLDCTIDFIYFRKRSRRVFQFVRTSLVAAVKLDDLVDIVTQHSQTLGVMVENELIVTMWRQGYILVRIRAS